MSHNFIESVEVVSNNNGIKVSRIRLTPEGKKALSVDISHIPGLKKKPSKFIFLQKWERLIARLSVQIFKNSKQKK